MGRFTEILVRTVLTKTKFEFTIVHLLKVLLPAAVISFFSIGDESYVDALAQILARLSKNRLSGLSGFNP